MTNETILAEINKTLDHVYPNRYKETQHIPSYVRQLNGDLQEFRKEMLGLADTLHVSIGPEERDTISAFSIRMRIEIHLKMEQRKNAWFR